MKQLMVIFSFIVVQGLYAQNPYPPQPYPDRIVLNVTEDPSTSIGVNWRTHAYVSEGAIEWMPVSADPAAVKDAQKQSASSETVEHDGITARYHSTVVKNLKPNTNYMYRVGNGEHWSEWFHTTTAGVAGQKLSFIYFGDVQLGMRSFWPRVIREAYKKMPDAALVMYAGDIVNRGRNDHEWGELFYGGSYIHSTVPSMPSPGNHEHADNAKGVNELTALWRPQFTLPENGMEGLKETTYYTDVQDVRFISLNSQSIWFGGEPMKKQMEWLENVLKSNPKKWSVVIFHHPVYSVKANRDNTNLRENFQPIFNKYKVDLVLQGHDHAYGRGKSKIPMPDGGVSPVTYVVSMSGSKMYEADKQPWMDHFGSDKQLYQLITVEGNKLSYRSYDITGALFDAFDLTKRRGQDNLLSEVINLK